MNICFSNAEKLSRLLMIIYELSCAICVHRNGEPGDFPYAAHQYDCDGKTAVTITLDIPFINAEFTILEETAKHHYDISIRHSINPGEYFYEAKTVVRRCPVSKRCNSTYATLNWLANGAHS